MDFAPEPIMDAFTPAPRAPARASAAAGDDGPTFDEHLEIANEIQEAGASAPPSTEPTVAKPDAPVEAKPAPNTDTSRDLTDPETALLGGPLAAPPPMAAPVLVQIATAQTAPPASPAAVDPSSGAPPASAAPQTPIAPTPAAPPPDAAKAAAPDTPATPNGAKAGTSEAKTAPPPQTSQPNTSAPSPQPETTAAPQQNSASSSQPITVQQLPEAVRQALAATIAPAPQLTEAAQRPARPVTPAIEPTAPAAPNAKAANAAPNAAAKTQTAKAVAAPAATSDAALQTQAPSPAPDASQLTSSSGTTAAAQTSTHVQHAAADTGAQRAAPAATQVAREIVRRFDGGNTSFELRLDPPELGRVEVRMEVSRDHRVTAVIAADSPQALTELARHARELEAQLQSAGLQLSDNGLSFDLRQGAHGGDAQDAGAAQRGGGEETAAEQPQTPAARPIGFERWRGVRVDMMV